MCASYNPAIRLDEQQEHKRPSRSRSTQAGTGIQEARSSRSRNRI